MNYSLNQVQEFIEYWTAQPESNQRTVCLKVWIKEAQKFIKYSRRVYSFDETSLIANTGEEVKAATSIVAAFFKVPKRKAGENRDSSMHRLTALGA